MAIGRILNAEEEHQLVSRIRALEGETTGEVHIHVAKRKASRHGIMADATHEFKKLGIDRTLHHNGVLLYISLGSRNLACIGDRGIFEKAGKAATDSFFEEIVSDVTACFKKGDYFLGLLAALDKLSQFLSEHFPADSASNTPSNQISDEISKD